MENTYIEPVSKLLDLVEMDWSEWDDYSEFGFTEEHIPELLRLGTDRTLLDLSQEVDDAKLWAPMHAWRILVQMQAAEALASLTRVFDWSEEMNSDLIGEGLPDAFVVFGAPAVDLLANFLNEPGHAPCGYVNAIEALGRIGVEYPGQRDRIIRIAEAALEASWEYDEEGEVNGFLISILLDLDSAESYSLIKKTFETKKVASIVAGDLEDVEIELGLREKRELPAWNMSVTPFEGVGGFPNEDEYFYGGGGKATLQDKERLKKEKNKRKQEKKSRKKNRKKK